MATYTWRIPPRCHVPVPRAFVGLGQALGWKHETIKLLWSVLSDNQDPLLKGVSANYLLLDQRLATLDPDSLVCFIKAQASPQVLIRLTETACQRRVLRRKEASQIQEVILRSTTATGAWRES